MKTKISIYGGIDLKEEQIRFTQSLTRNLLQFPDVTLISGGFDYYVNDPKKISVDRAVLDAAEKYLDPKSFEDRFETWIPKESDLKKKRFEKGKVHRIEGSTQARRFTQVQQVDALITISGSENTQSVIELALAINKPVLPIAFTGDRSLKMWKQFSDDIIKSLKLKDKLINELKATPQSDESIDNVAREVAIFIRNVIQKKCFVLMPFGGKHDEFYLNTLMPAIDKAEYIPDRIDLNNQTGNIYSLFISSLEQARAVIVDITGLNENVMYELGYVHAKNINPLIIHRSSPDESVGVDDLPFYLKSELFVNGSEDSNGYKSLQEAVVYFLDRLSKNNFISKR